VTVLSREARQEAHKDSADNGIITGEPQCHPEIMNFGTPRGGKYATLGSNRWERDSSCVWERYKENRA